MVVYSDDVVHHYEALSKTDRHTRQSRHQVVEEAVGGDEEEQKGQGQPPGHQKEEEHGPDYKGKRPQQHAGAETDRVVKGAVLYFLFA